MCDGGFDISEDWDLVAIYNYNTKGYIKVILYCTVSSEVSTMR